jgi:hypothetical protein
MAENIAFGIASAHEVLSFAVMFGPSEVHLLPLYLKN